VRDAQGATLAVYGNKNGDGQLYWKEQHLYGSSRLGIWNADIALSGGNSSTKWQQLGNKSYELSNHLGNVLATISDKPVDVVSGGVIDHYDAEVLSAQDYYPFGMLQPDRKWSLGNYRYGFNGKENDNEVKGEGNQQDYGMRVYDPRIGKFLSVDPLMQSYPWYTPYQFAGNTPIQAIDLDGEEELILSKSIQLWKIGRTIFKAVRSTEMGKVFSKQLRSQNKIDVYYFLFDSKETNAGGKEVDATYIHKDGTIGGPHAQTSYIKNAEEFKQQQKEDYFISTVDKDEISKSLKNGKSIIVIGIPKQVGEALILYSKKEVAKFLFSNSYSINLLSSTIQAVLHEETAHALEFLRSEGDKKTTGADDHLKFNGEYGDYSPTNEDLKTDPKYKATSARKALEQAENQAKKILNDDK
jgi:RHS repeat-associated protein